MLFQGGGVKGLVYAGAIEMMPQGTEPLIVGGSSAGANAAAFVAVGFRGKELVKAMSDLDVGALLGKDGPKLLKEMQKRKLELDDISAKSGM